MATIAEKDHRGERCRSACDGAMWDQGFDDFVDPCNWELWESYLNMSRAAQENYDWDNTIDTPYLDDNDGFLINGLSFGLFILCAIFKF